MYKTLFTVSPILIQLPYVIFFLFCIVIGYSYFKQTNKKTLAAFVHLIVFICFSVTFLVLFLQANIVNFYAYKRLQQKDYYITEGIVEQFKPGNPLGHDVESFYINDVFFSYSNSYNGGYSKTSACGGCVKKNGQNIKVFYYKVGDENIILKIQERIDQTIDIIQPKE